MIFLVEYDRSTGAAASITPFANHERLAAEKARLDLEVRLNQTGVEKEVVLLEAPNEQALRATHRRYFESLQELVRSSATIAR